MEVTYKDIKRKAFDEVADLCECPEKVSNPYFTSVKVYYRGTNLKGDMIVETAPGKTKIYNEMLTKVAEILSKY